MSSSSLGSVQLLKCSNYEITQEICWDKLHKFKNGDSAPCTDIGSFDGDIISVGEDGRIVLLSVGQKTPVQIIG